MTAGRDRSLVVDVGDLRRRPGSRLSVPIHVAAAGIRMGEVAVLDGALVEGEIELESLSDGLVATGHVRARWTGSCRRCLERAEGDITVPVRELFRPTAGADEEAFPIEDDQVDLRPLITEVLVCDLPLAPVCRADCRGLCPECGADRNAGDCGHRAVVGDPRWAALEGLRDQLG